jgi:hypothetical protein
MGVSHFTIFIACQIALKIPFVSSFTRIMLLYPTTANGKVCRLRSASMSTMGSFPFGSSRPGLRSRLLHVLGRSWRSAQQPLGADVFVNFWPVDTVTASGNLPIAALLGGGVRQPWVPGQRSRDGAAVLQANAQLSSSNDTSATRSSAATAKPASLQILDNHLADDRLAACNTARSADCGRSTATK